VGINRYQDRRIPELQFAERDAEVLASLLPDLGFPAENARLLINSRLPITRELILKVLEEDLNPKIGSEDRLLLFFAGHGVSTEVHRERRGYLLMANSELFGELPDSERPYAEKPPASALEMGNLLNIVRGLPAKHQLLLIDSCFSGFMAHGRKVVEVKANDPRLERWSREAVTQVLTAGRSGQIATEKDLYGHGVFTWHLIKGLEGAADPRGDGLITFHELGVFVHDRVSQEAGVAQDPQMGSIGEGEFIILYQDREARARAERAAEEERKRKEEERRRAEEVRRREEVERAARIKAQREAEEARRKAERLAAERRAAEEERKKKEEEQRRAEEVRRREEAKRAARIRAHLEAEEKKRQEQKQRERKRIIWAIIGAFMICGFILKMSWLFREEEKEPLIVPANEIFIIDTSNYVGERELKIEAHLKNNNRKKYIIIIKDLSPNEKEKLNIALNNYHSFFIKEEYVNSGPRPDPNNSGLYKYPVGIGKAEKTTIIINDTEALVFK